MVVPAAVLYKLEDDDTNEISYTNIACKLLDINDCRCREYERRNELMPTCVILDAAECTRNPVDAQHLCLPFAGRRKRPGMVGTRLYLRAPTASIWQAFRYAARPSLKI